MAASLGSLVVSLSAETAQFTAALNKASYTAQKNFADITSFAKSAAGTLAALYGAGTLAGFIKSQIDLADATGKMSQKVGVSVEELSKLQYAAKLADVDSQQLQGGLVRLAKGMSEAAQGTGEAKKAFDAMGISIKNADGTLKTNTQILNETSDAFAKYSDGATKTALAVAIFGRAGADLIPLLNGGSKALKEAGDELARFGGVVTAEAAKNAERFNDNLTRIRETGSALGKSIANDILPYLTRLTEEFLVARANGISFLEMLDMGTRIGNYGQQIQKINQEIDDLNSGFSLFSILGKKDERLESLLRQKKTLQELQAAAALTGQVYEDQISRRFMRDQNATKVQAPVMFDAEKYAKGLAAAQDANSKFLSSMRDLAAQTQLEMDAVFMSDTQRKNQQNLLKIQKDYETSAVAITKQFKDGNLTAKDYNDQIQILAANYISATDLAKKLFENQEELNASWEYGAAVSLSKYAIESQNLAKLTGTVVSGALNNMENSLYNIFAGTQTVAQGFRSMVASILQDIAKLMIRQSITAPLAQALSNAFGFGAQGTVQTQTPVSVIDYSSPISGQRANGGMVLAGRSYLVGERGAEMFTPNMNGNITPNEKIGESVVVNQTINIQTGVSQTVRNEIQSMMPRIMEATKAAVADSKRRGGTYGAMMA
jgi:lambda family phage tail tape measure protein